MDRITSKDVRDSVDTTCFNRTEDRKRKCETTHREQKYNKLLCKDSPVYNLVEQCKENSFNLLNFKRKQVRKENIEQGKIF